MYAHGRIVPLNGEAFMVKGDTQPSWGQSAQGGLDAGVFPGEFTDAQLDSAFGADAYIEVAGKVVYHGRIVGVNTEALIATSLEGALVRMKRGRIYKVPMLDKWMDNLVSSTNGGCFKSNITNGVIRLTQEPGSVVGDNGPAANDSFFLSSWNADAIARFDYSVLNNKSTLFNTQILASGAKLGSGASLASHLASATAQTVTVGTKALNLRMKAYGTANPTDDDHWVEFYDMQFYGVVLTSTPNLYDSEVLADIMGGLTSYDYAGDATYIEAGTVDMSPLEFPVGTNLLAQAVHVANRAGKQFGGWPRYSDGKYKALPVYRDMSTTAAYYCDATTENVVENFAGMNINDYGDRVIVEYRDKDDINLYATASLTDETNKFTAAHVSNDVLVGMGTGTAAQAALLASETLDVLTEERIGGTVEVSGQLVDYSSGATILPSDIEAGLILATGTTRYGLVKGRILRADHVDADTVRIQIDTSYEPVKVQAVPVRRRVFAAPRENVHGK